MAKGSWTAFAHASKAYAYPGEALKKNWARLHRGDCEPYPKDAGVQDAWRLFHQGKFAEAVALGLERGGAGVTAANKAQAIYANYLEPKESTRIALFEEVMKRAEAQARAEPKNANAHYLYAYAARRYSQRISVAKALAQGYGDGLVLMHGRKMVAEAGTLYSKAAAIEPRDAMEKLDVEAAARELE